MIFIEDKNFLNKEQKLFVDSFFKKQPFAFYYQEDSVENDSRSVLMHHLISRKNIETIFHIRCQILQTNL